MKQNPNITPQSLGISVYLQHGDPYLQQVEDYLSMAAQLDYKRVFSSIHLPEDDFDESLELLTNFVDMVAAHSLKLMLDVSAQELNHIVALPAYRKLFHGRIHAIRFDYGPSIQTAISQCVQLGVESFVLNASTISGRDLNHVLTHLERIGQVRIQLSACHNFYPRPETGLSLAFMRSQSQMLTSHGIPVSAFIAAHDHPRGPLFEGLPTVERHRHMEPCLAAQELLSSGVISEILLGDPFAAQENLQSLRTTFLHRPVILRMLFNADCSAMERTIALQQPHLVRPDSSPDVIRSWTSREISERGPDIEPGIPSPRDRYSVTVDNRGYLRYSGELQITLQDLSADERVNVIGQIIAEDQKLIRSIQPGMSFLLMDVSQTD